MVHVLLAGLTDDLAVWLGEQLSDVAVHAAGSGAQVLELLNQGAWSLLIMDHSLNAPTAVELLRGTRRSPALANVPVLYCMENTWSSTLLEQLVGELGVRQLLFHPLDRDELAREARESLGLKAPSPSPVTHQRHQLQAAMARLWDQNKSTIMSRVGVIQQAAVELLDGQLGEEGRREAVGEAHKLAGTLGTYGYYQGSYLARELEHLVQPGEDLGQEETLHVAQLVNALRQELERSQRGPTQSSTATSARRILVIDADPGFSRQITIEAIGQGMRSDSVIGTPAARSAINRERPDLVVLDLSRPDGARDGLALMAELRDSDPPVPVLVMTSRDTFTDRVEVARLGGRGFLQKPLSPTSLMQAINRVLDQRRATRASVMVVDDDPVVLATLRDLLEPEGFRVTTVDGPLRFWNALAEATPDILVLDIEMPHVSGIELCRVVRNDPRWAALPVLFLSVHSDPDTIYRVFAARADDFVSKPIVGPELITRITNRLERTQLLRSQAEKDGLTGVVNHMKSGETLERLFQVADHHTHPVCLAVLDIDYLKQINNTQGHPSAALALRRVGQLLQQSFGGDDVVGRWSGEEFVVGMYGMTRSDGVERIAEVLETVRQEQFSGPAGTPFHVTLSAGVTQYPDDGYGLQELYLSADRVRDSARFAGGDRVLSVGWRPDLAKAVRTPDVVLVDDDESVAKMMITWITQMD